MRTSSSDFQKLSEYSFFKISRCDFLLLRFQRPSITMQKQWSESVFVAFPHDLSPQNLPTSSVQLRIVENGIQLGPPISALMGSLIGLEDPSKCIFFLARRGSLI